MLLMNLLGTWRLKRQGWRRSDTSACSVEWMEKSVAIAGGLD
jgi:hypothetical protein